MDEKMYLMDKTKLIVYKLYYSGCGISLVYRRTSFKSISICVNFAFVIIPSQ